MSSLATEALPLQQVTILDRHHLFRQALFALLRRRLPDVQLRQVEHLDQLNEGGTGLLMVDINLPALQGMGGLVALTRQHPERQIIAVADDWPEQPATLFDRGAMACISKSATADEFIEAIQSVLRGRCWLRTAHLNQPYCLLDAHDFSDKVNGLSPRRQHILGMVAKGMLNKQIAHELAVCESTIKTHVSAIMRALGLRNRTQLAIEANRGGMGHILHPGCLTAVSAPENRLL